MIPQSTEELRAYRDRLASESEGVALTLAEIKSPLMRGTREEVRRALIETVKDSLVIARACLYFGPMDEEPYFEACCRGIDRALEQLGDPPCPRAAVATEGNRLWIP